jgi:hypothetical protein
MAENKWSKATPVILFYFLSNYQNNASIKDRLKLQYVGKIKYKILSLRHK